MWRGFLRIVVAVCLGTAAVLSINAYRATRNAAPTTAAADAGEDPDDGYPAAKVELRRSAHGSTLRIDGLLVKATMVEVNRVLAAHSREVTSLQIKSGGGLGPYAGRLADIVNAARIPVVVANDTLCSSACVFFLAAVHPELWSFEPRAWLRVHGNSAGPTDPADNDPSMRIMDAPIEAMSPNWHRFLVACPSRPLFRNAGLSMTWTEVQAVDRNPASIDCAKIAYRTKAWTYSMF